MKKILLIIALLFPLFAFSQLGGGTGTITQLDFWKATSTPNVGITPRTYGQDVIIPGDMIIGGNSTTSFLGITGLATPSGTFLAVNADGTVIATTSPSGSYGDDDVNAYIHSSTTIPKTYTDNVFTGGNTFVTATTTQLCFATGECMESPNVEGNTLIFYPSNNTAEIATYEDMYSYPSTGVTVDESCSAASGTAGGYCTIDTYISTTTDATILNYPAGTTRIHAFTYVDSVVGTSYIVFDGYKRDVAGNEVWIGQATSTEINQTVIQESMATFTGTSDYAFNADGTDRLVMKVRGWTDSVSAKTIHWTYQDTSYYSHIETPITLQDEGYTRKTVDETIVGDWTFSGATTFSSETNFSSGTTTMVNGHLTGNLQVDGLFFAPVSLLAGGDMDMGGYDISNIATTTTVDLVVSNQSALGTVLTGIWNGTAIGDTYLTKTGDWTGTFDGLQGSDYLANAFSTTSAIYFAHSSTTIPKTYTENTWTALQTFATGIFTTLTTNGTASSTSLVVSDNYLTVGGKKLYGGSDSWSDRISIPTATTTDETMKFGTCLRQGGPSVTITQIDAVIASTTQTSDYSNNGITFNINIADVPSTTSPMTAFSAVQWIHGTSSVLTFTPNSTVVIPAGYCYWPTFGTASTSQIEQLYINMWGYNNYNMEEIRNKVIDEVIELLIEGDFGNWDDSIYFLKSMKNNSVIDEIIKVLEDGKFTNWEDEKNAILLLKNND